MSVIYDKTQLVTTCSPFEFIDDKGKDQVVVDEIKATVTSLKEVLQASDNLLALAAPQIGIKKRIFCIKFDNAIKTFINPIIKKRSEDKFINQETFVDGQSIAYVCRPKEVEVTYFTDEFKVEDNKLLDQAAAVFMQQYNLLDGIVPGSLLDSWEVVSQENLPLFVDATYSGAGVVLAKDDDVPDLSEVAEVLTRIATAATERLKNLIDDTTEPDLAKLAKRFMFEESVILGHTKIVDQEGWEREKKFQRQAALAGKQAKAAQFKQLAARACK